MALHLAQGQNVESQGFGWLPAASRQPRLRDRATMAADSNEHLAGQYARGLVDSCAVRCFEAFERMRRIQESELAFARPTMEILSPYNRVDMAR